MRTKEEIEREYNASVYKLNLYKKEYEQKPSYQAQQLVIQLKDKIDILNWVLRKVG